MMIWILAGCIRLLGSVESPDIMQVFMPGIPARSTGKTAGGISTPADFNAPNISYH
jgi:hypothetical protein